MERARGEVFEFEGKKLKVVEGYLRCKECFFYNIPCPCLVFINIRGKCTEESREDEKNVYFVRV